MGEETKRLLDMLQQSLDQQKTQMVQQERQLEQITALQTENATLRGQMANGDRSTSIGTKKPDRPIVNSDLDDSDWELWKDRWKRYKLMIKITSPQDLKMELRASCSDEVDKLLFQYVGATVLDAASEIQLLDHIRSVAVKGIHVDVHRKDFAGLTQGEGELITHYVARLKSRAAMCDFTVKCSCDPVTTISYADKMVAHQLVVGLQSQEHQSRILSEADTLTTLKDKVDRLQILETTEESATKFKSVSGKQSGETSSSAAGRSSYQKYRREKSREQSNNTEKDKSKKSKCRGCGQVYHKGKKDLQRQECPAFDKSCSNCGIKGHYASVCERSKVAYTGIDDTPVVDDRDTHPSMTTQASGSFLFGAYSAQAEPQIENAHQQDFRLGTRKKDNR